MQFSLLNETPVISQSFEVLEKSMATRTVRIGDAEYRAECAVRKESSDARKSFYRGFLDGPLTFHAPKKRRIRYMDLFCGGGGLSLGVDQALRMFGFKPSLLFAADLDHEAVDLVRRNLNPLISRKANVTSLVNYSTNPDPKSPGFSIAPMVTDDELARYRGKIDLLVGGPPCQGHSNLNNKTRGNDPRNLLYYIMPAFALALDIPIVLIENVPSIRRAKENVVGVSKAILHDAGYEVQEIILTAADFAVAQTRQRHFLVASKIPAFDITTVSEQLKQESLSFDDVNFDLGVMEHPNSLLVHTPSISDENQRRIDYLHDNNLFELPNSERPECHKEQHTYPSVYGRIYPDRPMSTITTGFASSGRGRFTHPHQRRTLNAREAARIQAFPEWYWTGSEAVLSCVASVQKIVGDAVPPLMIEPLIASLLPALDQ